jgi:hypothetical protein
VLYGNHLTGLTTAGSQFITEEDVPGGHASQFAEFGISLTAANFGLGAEDDLVVGAFGDAKDGLTSGSVSIVYGSPTGLDDNTGGVIFPADIDDAHPTKSSQFGESLASGQLIGTGLADIVVGSPGESFDGHKGPGAVYVLRGRSGGVSAVGALRLTENDPGVPSTAEDFERFGASVAVANFGGTTAEDLAVDAPADKVGAFEGAGRVFVFPGKPTGPDESATQAFTLDTPGVPGAVAENAQFGQSLIHAANFGSGGRADLAVASRPEMVAGKVAAGAVRVLYGGMGGLSGTGSQRWTAASAGVAGAPGDNFQFGGAFG